MNTPTEGRFLVCSKIMQMVLAAVMLVCLVASIVKQRQKKYEEVEQMSTNQLDENKESKTKENPPCDVANEPDQSCCFKISQKLDNFIMHIPLLAILVLNIVCFCSYEYLLISFIGYLILLFLQAQDMCNIQNFTIKIMVWAIPSLIIMSWFINFFISDMQTFIKY